MAIREVVQLIFNADTGKVSTGLRSLGTEAAATDKKLSLMDKGLAKVGVSSSTAGAMVKGALAGGIAAAGAAALAFGEKSVRAFQEGALAADKMARSTGLSTEQASRWIEAGDDLGITADQLGVAFGRFTKSLSANSASLAKYGVEAVRTKSGAVDMNATLLATIDTLNKTTDPIKRSELANAAFGRGWQEVSELVTSSAADVSKALADVSDQRVFDGDEVAKAKQYRAAMDDLGDTVADLQNELGEGLVPALSAAAGGLSDFLGVANNLPDVLQGGGLGGLSSVFKEVWKDLGGGDGGGAKAQAEIDAATEAWVRARGAAIDMDGAAADLAAQNEELAAAQTKAADAARDQADALRDAVSAQLSSVSSSLGLANATADAEQELADYQQTAASTTQTAREHEAAERQVQGALLSVAQAAVRAAEDQAKAKGATLSASGALLAQQTALTGLKQSFPGLSSIIDAFIAKLNQVPRNITTRLQVIADKLPAGASPGRTYQAKAAGGPVGAGQAFTMNERVVSNTNRPEMVVAGSGNVNVIPSPMMPGGGGGGTTINVTVNALDPKAAASAVLDALQSAVRNGGRQRLKAMVA
jgi:hypothetical protein